MVLTLATFVVHHKAPHRAPDVVPSIIADFLIIDLSLAQACEWTHIGSVALLDLVWMRSLRDCGNSKWSVAKLLQSEPHYYQWEFSQALVHAVARDDFVVVQWLLTHFSGCPVTRNVVEEAARRGKLWVLQLLEGDKTHGGVEWSKSSVEEAAKAGDWELVRWLLKRCALTREERRENYFVAHCAFEQNNLAEMRWALANGFRMRSILPLNCSEVEWQGRAECIRYLLEEGDVLVENHGGVAVCRAAGFGDLDLIKWLAASYGERIDMEYWVHALDYGSEGGHLAVVEWILFNINGVVRTKGPAAAMFAAAEYGRLDIVQWLYNRYTSKRNVELFQDIDLPDDSTESGEIFCDDDLFPRTAMDAAARNGHLTVLQFLGTIKPVPQSERSKRADNFALKRIPHRQSNRSLRCTDFAMNAAAAFGHLDVVKWLQSNRSEGCTTTAMNRAAANGHFEVVEWLHLHRGEGCTTAAMDNVASKRFHLASCDGNYDDVCCLDKTPEPFYEKQLEMLKWLQQHRSEGCTTIAMDGAAANGDLKMLEWLRENTTAGCTSKAMISAARLGRMDITQWLHLHFPATWKRKAMVKAASHGHLGVVKWLRGQHAGEPVGKAIEKAAAKGHLRIVQWLLPHCATLRPIASAMGHSSRHFEVMLFLDAQIAGHYIDSSTDLIFIRSVSLAPHAIRTWFSEKYPQRAAGTISTVR